MRRENTMSCGMPRRSIILRTFFFRYLPGCVIMVSFRHIQRCATAEEDCKDAFVYGGWTDDAGGDRGDTYTGEILRFEKELDQAGQRK